MLRFCHFVTGKMDLKISLFQTILLFPLYFCIPILQLHLQNQTNIFCFVKIIFIIVHC